MKTLGLKLFSLVLSLSLLCSALHADETPSTQAAVVPTSEDTKSLSWLSISKYPLTQLQLEKTFIEPSVLRKMLDPEDDEFYMRLVDGSLWRVDGHDAIYYNVFKKWKANHLLTVGVSNDKAYPFILHNQNLNQKVKATLKTLGEESKEAMLTFAGCTANHYIKLENGTYWYIAEKDFPRIQENWKAGDVLVVAPATKFGLVSILINLTRNDTCNAVWLRY